MKSFVLLIGAFFTCSIAFSSSSEHFALTFPLEMNQIEVENLLTEHIHSIENQNFASDSSVHKTKLIAVSLAITLGVFGVHRLYLGTKPLVPIAYTLTLGGGFLILPLIDIFYIIASKDLEQITNNDNVFLWNKDTVESKR